MPEKFDAVVVGAGPNGLAAAIEIARAGRSVLVLEGFHEVGGSARTAELTLPGYLHDVCSAIHPAAMASPFLAGLPLDRHGLEWAHPQVPLAHPLDNGPAALMHRDLGQTAAGLGVDGDAYRTLMGPIVADWPRVSGYAFGPTLRLPKRPVAVARFGLKAMQPAMRLTRRFETDAAKALFGGLAAHGIAPLDTAFTSATALGLAAVGHTGGWPAAKGGSGLISAAMSSYLDELGGAVRTGVRVTSLDDLPSSTVQLLSVTPRQLLQMAEGRLPSRYARRMASFRYGPGVFKVDWALNGPIPWADPDVSKAGTVHLGGGLEEIAQAERDAWEGRATEKPFVILAQQSGFDPARAPRGGHTAWGYCHVPNGSTGDMTGAIEAQVERFAPGFGEVVEARHTMNSVDFEAYNPSLVGGDIAGGAMDMRQLLFRPVAGPDPYRTPIKGVYLCGASTAPGAGVHGMCGYHAARSALRREL